MSAAHIAVTGSTGAVGGLVARALSEAGEPTRLLVRDPARAPRLERSDVREASYGDRDAVGRALDGVSTVVMVSAAESAERLEEHRTFIDAAAAAGVEHVVYTSFQGAAPDATFTLARDHWATERHLEDSGMAWTFLRDSFYLDLIPLFAGDDGVIRGPAGEGRVAAVARHDVAAVGTRVLLDGTSHRDMSYTLTGPEALTLVEIAATVTRVTGREVSFHDETIEEAYASRSVWPAPQWQYDAWVSTYTAIARGEVAEVSGDVERVTGRAPLSLERVLRSAER